MEPATLMTDGNSGVDQAESDNITFGLTMVSDGDALVGQVFSGILLSMVIACVICGNLLVIAAVSSNRRLRSSLTNYFVLSLGVSDLLLGVIVLPFMMVTLVITDRQWLFGSTLCNLVTCADVTLCTASILNLFLTTCERYIAIVSPFQYRTFVTRKTVIFAITNVWLLSALCSFVPIHLGWNTVDGRVQNTRPGDNPNVCAFEWNIGYNTTLSIVTFYIPLVMLTFANIQIVRIANKQKREMPAKQRRRLTVFGPLSSNSVALDTVATFSTTIAGEQPNAVLGETNNNKTNQPPFAMVKINESAFQLESLIASSIGDNFSDVTFIDDDSRETSLSTLDSSLDARQVETDRAIVDETPRSAVNGCQNVIQINQPSNFTWSMRPRTNTNSSAGCETFGSRSSMMQNRPASHYSVARAIRIFTAENKAAITVLAVVGCFVTCWLPYFVLFTVKPYIDDGWWAQFSASYPNLETFAVWLGYLNSLCNPIIYTCMNRLFRLTFARLLRLSPTRKNSNNSYRRNNNTFKPICYS